MTFEEGMKHSIEETERENYELLGIIQEKDKAIAELVEKKTALEKRIFELKEENETLKMGLQYDSDNRDDILNENSDLQQKYLEESFEKAKLVKEIAELKGQFSDVLECFVSASSGDDFEMAESAREVMEVLNITCYRHGKVKSKLTEAKEIIRNLLILKNDHYGNTKMEWRVEVTEQAEHFLKCK